MLEAKNGFRQLKAHEHLPVLRATLQNQRTGQSAIPAVGRLADAASLTTSNASLGIFNRVREIRRMMVGGISSFTSAPWNVQASVRLLRVRRFPLK
jgi:hypothetical protein